MQTLDQLNAMTPDGFVAALDGVFEHAVWVAETAASRRPFPTVTALHDTLMEVTRAAPPELCVRFLQGHPPLSPKALADPGLTASSRSEQTGLGMSALGDQLTRFEALSSSYDKQFGFPFIVCVRRLTPHYVLRNLDRRLKNAPEQEREAALTEIGFITRLRLADRLRGAGMPHIGGHLSTHVLDTVKGKAAAAIPMELFREGTLVSQAVTNHDGRTDAALLPEGPLRIGRYELRFRVAEYYADLPGSSDPSWYDVIPIRFGISEPEGRYHIPLLLGAWTYTTYRGS